MNLFRLERLLKNVSELLEEQLRLEQAYNLMRLAVGAEESSKCLDCLNEIDDLLGYIDSMKLCVNPDDDFDLRTAHE